MVIEEIIGIQKSTFNQQLNANIKFSHLHATDRHNEMSVIKRTSLVFFSEVENLQMIDKHEDVKK
jgi:hypothetical protein